ncbi:MAG: ATP synthase F1 subunit epsilon [Thermoanaerobaculia bacterium]
MLMAVPETFHCSVVTPERAVLEVEAQFAALPAHDGEIGILRNRASLLVKLDVGRLRIETPDERHVLYVDGGFAEMVDNRLTVLTEDARRPDELDRRAAEASLAEARTMIIRDDASVEARRRAIKRAKVQLQLLQ